MTDNLRDLLWQWMFCGPEAFYMRFRAMPEGEQKILLGAIVEVIGSSDDDEFRKAANDIAVFLKQKEQQQNV